MKYFSFLKEQFYTLQKFSSSQFNSIPTFIKKILKEMNFYLNDEFKVWITGPGINLEKLYFQLPKQHRIIICFLIGHLHRYIQLLFMILNYF